MKKLVWVGLALLPLLGNPGRIAAQSLEPGKWTGIVIAPDGDRVDVTYDVSTRGDTLAITVNAGQHGNFAFNDVKLAQKTLTFWFTPGPRVDCTLTRRDDGAYDGTCKDERGGVAQMTMAPPKKG